MSKKIAPFLIALSFLSTVAFAEECTPKVGDTRETISRMSNERKVKGKEAAIEMEALSKNKANMKTQEDIFGRTLSAIIQTPISPVETIIEGRAFASARIDRYCSASEFQDAKCVDVCVRWTGYERD